MCRNGVILGITLLLVGCAAQQEKPKEQPTTQPTTRPLVDVTTYEPAASSPLAFDPPVTRDTPPLDLHREGRDPSAFAGYDEGVAEYFYIRVDDQQSYDNGSNPSSSSGASARNFDNSTYQRRTVIESAGVRFR